MTYIMVDIEADGPIPGSYSMISLGAVLVNKNLNQTFYAELKPISNQYCDKTLSISGFSREQTLTFNDPRTVMNNFRIWIESVCNDRAIFISDNNGFDWMFVNWYFHYFLNSNPFGYSSQNLGSLYKGIVKDTFQNFKHLRNTEHTHNALSDAMGNAEALLYCKYELGLKIKL